LTCSLKSKELKEEDCESSESQISVNESDVELTPNIKEKIEPLPREVSFDSEGDSQQDQCDIQDQDEQNHEFLSQISDHNCVAKAMDDQSQAKNKTR
jgi:hypothetical protein